MQSIWRVVAAIPAGRVATYGDVARLAGLPRGARQVGRALGQAPAALDLPWFRVLGAGGHIALPKGTAGYRTQVRRLRAEGLAVDHGRVRWPAARWTPDLDELLWGPP
jgi:methylated-DNA-protein-cysteine methyltransferase-like protein